jgi:alanine dehydrogenase
VLVGVPREIKPDENRVALVPSGVAAFVAHGHTVLVESGAGLGSGIPDADYRGAGARIVRSAKNLWDRAELVIKVKEPLGDELEWMHAGQVIYTYFHLASDEKLTRTLMKRGVICVAYETIQLEDGSLPLLTPMSEVAGRLAIQKGAQCLEAGSGGRGILLSGVSGVKPATVVILGAGVAGSNACHVAVGMGARVTVLDIDPARLRYLNDIMGGRVTTVMSNRATIDEEAAEADLLIGAVLIPGARAPRLVTEDMVRRMRPGSVILDIAIDQGGCCETCKPTTLHDPIYRLHGVVHYCVTNMPGAVPRTSTYALTNATLGYGLAIADDGLEAAASTSPALAKGVNIYRGKITYEAVAEAFGLKYTELGSAV